MSSAVILSGASKSCCCIDKVLQIDIVGRCVVDGGFCPRIGRRMNIVD